MADALTTLEGLGSMYGTNVSIGLIVLAVAVLIFKLFWYGLALYKTVERKQKGWFITLFILALVPINELGLVAIIYLLVYRERKPKKKK